MLNWLPLLCFSTKFDDDKVTEQMSVKSYFNWDFSEVVHKTFIILRYGVNAEM